MPKTHQISTCATNAILDLWTCRKQSYINDSGKKQKATATNLNDELHIIPKPNQITITRL
jgi:hypothetical protein